MIHYAVCYQTRYGRVGVVESHPDTRPEYKCFPSDKSRIGYVGCQSFAEAVKRAGMMERDEPNAWGIVE